MRLFPRLGAWILASTLASPVFGQTFAARSTAPLPPAVLESSTLGSAGAPAASSGFRLDGTLGQGMPVGLAESESRTHCAGFWGFLCGEWQQTGTGTLPVLAHALLPNAPNPFALTTRIAYAVGSSGPVEVAIYSLSGQRVATLWDGVREPGVYAADWDGTDQAGRRVASGIYFCRFRAEGFQAVRKMLVAR